MKDQKIELRWFSIMDYEEESKYLQERHSQGWKFTKVFLPGIYRFEKCNPENVVYQLDYNQEGIENKEEYVQMFQDCGWEYLFDYVGYSYFRKSAADMEGKEEIFCDDESRLDMINRIFKGRMLPLVVIFFCIIIPQIVVQSIVNGIFSLLTIIFVVLFVLYLSLFIKFALKYYSFKKKIEG